MKGAITEESTIILTSTNTCKSLKLFVDSCIIKSVVTDNTISFLFTISSGSILFNATDTLEMVGGLCLR